MLSVSRPIDVVVVYKIDRLSRALMDFARLVEVFDRHGVTFVSVTQSFNTTTSTRPASMSARRRCNQILT
jgi:DNA invertase Pin-like site-specific DNA recombinase